MTWTHSWQQSWGTKLHLCYYYWQILQNLIYMLTLHKLVKDWLLGSSTVPASMN